MGALYFPAMISSALDSLIAPHSPSTIAGLVLASGVVVATTYLLTFGPAERRGKFIVTGGSLKKVEVADGWSAYDEWQNTGEGAKQQEKHPTFVDTFYNLVTDIYEYGWGQSFHFSPSVKGMSNRDSTRLHEEYVADLLKLRPGMVVLDAGCGVGGPMRAIAKYSQARVVGITINDYQVQRAKDHNRRAKVDHLCRVVEGNFLKMPFKDNSFDAVYSIEATCHAPKLTEVYAEIYRVLKPGQLYVTYEWVSTPMFDSNNEEHVKIIDNINYGNALPEMRTYKQIGEAAREVGFEVLEDRDLALPPALPWWSRLKMGKLAYYRNGAIITVLSTIKIAPEGLQKVHEMLYNVATWLVRGGETGIFSPMHLLVLRKPLSAGTSAEEGQ